MTPEMIEGLLVCLTISTACAIFCPILYWVLPNRSKVSQPTTTKLPLTFPELDHLDVARIIIQ